MPAKRYARIMTDERKASSLAHVRRCRNTDNCSHPVEVTVAGVTILMTDEGARLLQEQLRQAVPPASNTLNFGATR